MGYNRESKNKNLISVIFVMTIGLLSMVGWMTRNGADNIKSLAELEVRVAQLEASRESLANEAEEMKKKNDTLVKQIEELTDEMNKLKEQGINVEITTSVTEEKKHAYLTFDDGPSQNTIKILDFLKANNIQATFFVLDVKGYDDVYKRIVDEGHTIAVHSATHDYKDIYLTVDHFMADINVLSTRIEELTGVVSKVLRFPGGSNNGVSQQYGGADIMERIIERVENEGYVYFDWNVDSGDADKALQDKDIIVQNVINQSSTKKNAIILMHDTVGKTTTVEALPEIIEGLKAQGYVFRPLTTETAPIQFK